MNLPTTFQLTTEEIQAMSSCLTEDDLYISSYAEPLTVSYTQPPIPIKVRKTMVSSKIPTYGSEGAACFDLYTTQGGCIMPGATMVFGLGLEFEFPPEYEMQLRSRSGLAAKGVVVANSPGCVDSDYTAEVKVILHNSGPEPYMVHEGDRIAQGCLQKVNRVNFLLTDISRETARGGNGFGSTGK